MSPGTPSIEVWAVLIIALAIAAYVGVTGVRLFGQGVANYVAMLHVAEQPQ